MQEAKLREVRGRLGNVAHLILIDGEPMTADGWTITLAELENQGKAWNAANPGHLDELAESIGPGDLATLIYTSGTTGKPKGVMLTHDNWIFEGESIAELNILGPTDKQLLFLPLAHSFGKVLEMTFIRLGVATAIDGVIDDLVANLAVVRPTIMAGVPRVFEKVYNRVVTGAREGGGVKYKIFQWALDVGGRVSRLRQQGRQPVRHARLPAPAGRQARLFQAQGPPGWPAPLPDLRRRAALARHRRVLPLLRHPDPRSLRPHRDLGRQHRQPPRALQVRHRGHALQGRRGAGSPRTARSCCAGAASCAATTTSPRTPPRPWSRTAGSTPATSARSTPTGFITITDRKKDILVTAGGKNIAPQNIEGQLKASCPYVSQVVMLGDRRPFCVALVTINEETTGKWAREHGIDYKDYADLASRPEVKQLIRDGIEAVNASLASYERIKDFHLLDHDLSAGERRADPQDEHQAQGRGEPQPGDSGRVLSGDGGADLRSIRSEVPFRRRR